MKFVLRKYGILTAATLACLGTAHGAFAGEYLRLRAFGPIVLPTTAQSISTLDASPRHFVVQFNDRIQEVDKNFLRNQGIKVERYLPDDALLVFGTPQTIELCQLSSQRIRAAVPFAAEWKVSPEFWTERQGASAEKRELLLVSVLSDSSASNASELAARVPGVVIESVRARDFVATAPLSKLVDIARIDAVEWIQRAPVFVSFVLPVDSEPLDSSKRSMSLTGYESGTKLMGLEAAWSRGYNGEGQIATVADTGLDTGDASTLHPDFQGSFLKGYLTGLAVESWGDPQGHGTHVSGSVASTGRASDGAFKGGAHGGKLIMQGLWSALLDNLAPGTDMNRMFGTVYSDGSRIHSNSWGSPRNLGEYDTYAVRVDEYMWNNPEMLVLFAAGNSGEDRNGDGKIDEGSVSSPGTAKNVLTVGASENLLAEGGIQKPLKELRDGMKKWGAEPIASDTLSNNPSGIAAFSSRGPTSDGRLKPEIVAPGTNIVSTRSHHPKAGVLWGAYDDNYAYAGGTSMATPLTAGAATVLRGYLVKARGMSNPSAAMVKGTLMHTAHDLFPGQYGTGITQELASHRPNMHEGYGRVDMDAATALGDETLLVDEKTGVGLNETKSITVRLKAGEILRATLCYTDAPGSASASRTLVNDIDLKIISPQGEVFENKDRVNNSEMLELSDLPAGTYTVSVTGVNVPQGKNGKQPYALAVTAR